MRSHRYPRDLCVVDIDIGIDIYISCLVLIRPVGVSSFKFQVYINRRMTANTPQRPNAFPSVGYQRRLDSSGRARRPCGVGSDR